MGVDAPLDFDGHLRDDVQQAAYLVRDRPLSGGQLAGVAVVCPEVLNNLRNTSAVNSYSGKKGKYKIREILR